MVGAASIALFLVSRGKWADAIIDTGNEWLWPDALYRGELLYRDVVYWFGPLTPYVHAGAFTLLGSSFSALLAAGLVASLLTLAALQASLRLVTGRTESALWTALSIPMLVFMPYSGGSLLGMGYRMWHAAALTLAALCFGLAPRRRRLGPWAAGACVGLAALCRPDWGVIALLGLAAGLWRRRAGLRAITASTVAAAAVFFGVMLPFVAAAGLDRFFTESFVFLLGLPDETRRSALGWTGWRHWPQGLWSWIYAASVWTAVFASAVLAARRRTVLRPDLRRLTGALLLLLVLGAGAFAAPRSGSLLFAWAPVACAAALVVGWRRGRAGAVLFSFGIVGLLGLARRLFDLRDFGYVAPAMLFAYVCAAALVRLAIRKGPHAESERFRRRRAVRLALAVLVAAAFLFRLQQYAADSRVSVRGTGGMLTASPWLAASLNAAANEIRTRTPESATLAVFPDGAVLNFLSGRANPLRHKLYVEGFLRSSNEDAVLAELERRPPDAVVVLDRPDGHEPPRVFGRDYGTRVRRWLEERYALAPIPGTHPDPAGFPLLLGFRRDASAAPYNPGP